MSWTSLTTIGFGRDVELTGERVVLSMPPSIVRAEAGDV